MDGFFGKKQGVHGFKTEPRIPLGGSRNVRKRRAQESVSVTVLYPEASRIALQQSDGNEEALRLYMKAGNGPCRIIDTKAAAEKHIPRASIAVRFPAAE